MINQVSHTAIHIKCGASDVNTARLAGFIPSKRQTMPGTQKLWEGYLILSLFTESYRAMRDCANIESTVCH